MVLEIHQPRGLLDVKSQLYLTPFGIGAPFGVSTWLPCIVVDFPWLQSSTQESNTQVSLDQQVTMPCEMFNCGTYQCPSTEKVEKSGSFKDK